jgi:hypothetical protein
MLLEGLSEAPPEGGPSPPFSEPAEKPEPPQWCHVGCNTAKPCFAECKTMLWNANIGYWYRAHPKQGLGPIRNETDFWLVGASMSELGSLYRSLAP